jgi:hypothetical protein
MRPLRFSRLIPPGFVLDRASHDGDALQLTVKPQARWTRCPACGTQTCRVHSRYQRHLDDLPIAGRPARLMLQARRFHCDAVCCGRRIFTERFDPEVLVPWARRTNRLEVVVHHLAIALGGRPAARLARQLLLPVGKDTLLRVVRRRGSPTIIPPTVVGMMGGHGDGTAATAPSSVTPTGIRLLLSYLTASRQPRRTGSPVSRRLPSWPGTVPADMPSQWPGPCRTPPRSLTVGT